jgi:hypothetical protein
LTIAGCSRYHSDVAVARVSAIREARSSQVEASVVTVEIREHSADDLGAYAEVCSAFEVSRTLEVIVQDGGLGGW